MARFYCPAPLQVGATLDLPAQTARHVQVLRLQPGEAITLFNGEGGSYSATVTAMGRQTVSAQVLAHDPHEREAARAVHLAVGMPANERMDWLVEKATELGVARITPLMTTRSVLRLSGERAERKQAHWQAVAAAACAQCGRNRLPVVDVPVELKDWLPTTADEHAWRAVLSLAEGAVTWSAHMRTLPVDAPVLLALGPEGGWSDEEDTCLRTQGFTPVDLGVRVLRAETAALAALATLTL